MMLVAYLLALLLSFYILAIICDRYFVASLQIIGNKLKISDDVAGATLMAVGSSAPELFTVLIATFTIGAEDIGAGTIVGSAIFNILVIIGGSAFVATAYLKWQPAVRDMLFYVASILLLFFTFRDGIITMYESIAYVGMYIFYIVFLSQWKRFVPHQVPTDELEKISEATAASEEKMERRGGIFGTLLHGVDTIIGLPFPNLTKRPNLYPLTFVVSIAVIIACSWLLVQSGVGIATILNIPQAIVALTILAAGTSIPDLLSSLIVAKQGRGDMAVSNATGSNIFDILFCLGLPWLILTATTGESLHVSTESLISSVMLLFASVIAIIFILVVRKFKIGRKSGLFLIGLYVAYVIYAASLTFA